MMQFYLIIFCCLLLGSPITSAYGSNPTEQIEEKNSFEEESVGSFTNIAILQGLDKVMARVSTLKVQINHEINFGHLRILVKKCWRSSPEDPPESKAFLEIMEEKPGASRVTLFTGWMFASAPYVSALEHPVYDVWLKECTGEVTETAPKKLLREDVEIAKPETVNDRMEALYKGLVERRNNEPESD